MLVSFVIYYITIFCVLKKLSKRELKVENFPRLYITKNGIEFFSLGTHKIKINVSNLCLFENILYLKDLDKIVIIKNVEDVKVFNQNLYFKCKGKVKIIFDCKKFFRFFTIKIESKQFDLNELKNLALVDMLNNVFNPNSSKFVKKYIKILQNTLNISILREKIVIRQNKYHLSFSVLYKVNGKIRRVNINQTV